MDRAVDVRKSKRSCGAANAREHREKEGVLRHEILQTVDVDPAKSIPIEDDLEGLNEDPVGENVDGDNAQVSEEVPGAGVDGAEENTEPEKEVGRVRTRAQGKSKNKTKTKAASKRKSHVISLDEEEDGDDAAPISKVIKIGPSKVSSASEQVDAMETETLGPQSSPVQVSYDELIQTRVAELSDVTPLTRVNSLAREYPELEYGQVVVRRGADQDLIREFTRKPLTPEACRARVGLASSETLAMIDLATTYWKAAEEQEKLAKTMLARKNEELLKLEEEVAKVGELKEDKKKLQAELEKAKEEHSDLDSAYETLKLVKDHEIQLKEEAWKSLGEANSELARHKEESKKMAADLELAKQQLEEVPVTLAKKQEELNTARQQWELDLADAVRVAKAEAVDAYKASDELHNHITKKAGSFWDVGRAHMARRIVVDPSVNISIEQLAQWAAEDPYNTAARPGHNLVPYNDNDLEIIAKDDAAAEAEIWTPPPVEPVNYGTILSELEEPDSPSPESGTPKHRFSESGKPLGPQQQEGTEDDQAATSNQVGSDPAS